MAGPPSRPRPSAQSPHASPRVTTHETYCFLASLCHTSVMDDRTLLSPKICLWKPRPPVGQYLEVGPLGGQGWGPHDGVLTMGLAPLQGKRAQSSPCPLVDTVRRWCLQGEGARPDLPAPGPPLPASRAAGERCARLACCSSSPRRLRRPLNFSETNPAASYPPCLRISW